MDEHEVADEIRSLVEGPDALHFADATTDHPPGDGAGFVINFPRGAYLVVVVQIGD